MRNFTCRFPAPTTGKQLVLDALEAIERELKPLETCGPTTPIPVYLGADAYTRLSATALKHGLAIRDAVEGLAWALHQWRSKHVASQPSADTTAALRTKLRSSIIQGIDAGRIVLAEGSTGLGKTQILAATAQHILANDPEAVVWVATLTTNLIGQMVSEFEEVSTDLAPSILLGRQQFISERRTRLALAEKAKSPTPDPALEARIEEWLAAGAPPRGTDSKSLAACLPGAASHFTGDLADLIGESELNLADCRLIEKEDNEPASTTLTAMVEAAAGASLVICTQAMLMTRIMAIEHEKPLPFTHVLIDEAHELENVTATLRSHELSLSGLRSWVRRQELTHGPTILAALAELGGILASDSLGDGFRQPASVVARIRELLTPVGAALKRARKGEDAERRHHLHAITGILGAQDHWIGLSYSPVRRYPSILAGPSSVAGTLASLWNRVEAAALVSGTIYIPILRRGELTSGYVASKLNIPPARAQHVGPITAPWVYETPTLMLPSSEDVPRLCYPTDNLTVEDGEEAEQGTIAYDEWIRAIAAIILHAATTAKGGTLILCTAFRDVRELRKLLELVLGKRLLTHERNRPIAVSRQHFIALHRHGLRPVWIAAGPAAGTGLDLRERTPDGKMVPAAKDTQLTDLLIVRAGWGVNRSSTLLSRIDRLRWSAILAEAAILLRQEIGRLIRAEGLLDRRLWILDGRLFSPEHKHLNPTAAVFDHYTKREHFRIP